jgi:UTP-glucose-1-phosphate uridylyltransferase
LTDALGELLKLEGLNVFEMNPADFDFGIKQSLLSANLAMYMLDPETKKIMKKFIEKSGL